jgi:glucose-6-phosphate 1-epimerase
MASIRDAQLKGRKIACMALCGVIVSPSAGATEFCRMAPALSGTSSHANTWKTAEQHGISVFRSATSEGTAVVAQKGGQLLSWKPHGAAEILWVSPLASFVGSGPIRGGIPICWPWFGMHRIDPKQPQHGLVRTATWERDEISPDGDLRLRAPEPVLDGLAVALQVHAGETLALTLITTNLGPQPTTITEALHTYFRIGGLKTLRVAGLDGCDYADNADPRAVGQPYGPIKKHAGPVSFDGNEITRIYHHSGVCTLIDAGLGRLVRIEKEGSDSTVVWNPGAEKAKSFADLPPDAHDQFICIESGTAGPHSVSLAPGETHVLSVTYSVEAL